MAKSTCFIDIIWLQNFGLRRETVMQYFYTSPFFDPSSNNSIMQTQGIDLEHLKSMKGLEFVLDEEVREDPVLFVIKKQLRHSPTSSELLEVFYVLDGTIYQCPDLLELASSRFFKVAGAVSRAYRQISERIEYTPQYGHRFVELQAQREGAEAARPVIELYDFGPLFRYLDGMAVKDSVNHGSEDTHG